MHHAHSMLSSSEAPGNLCRACAAMSSSQVHVAAFRLCSEPSRMLRSVCVASAVALFAATAAAHSCWSCRSSLTWLCQMRLHRPHTPCAHVFNDCDIPLHCFHKEC